MNSLKMNQLGDYAEALLLAEIRRRGGNVAQPYSQMQGWDLITETLSGKLIKVQVKYCDHSPMNVGFIFTKKLKPNYDLAAFYLARLNIWYFVPATKMHARSSYSFYPNGESNKSRSKYGCVFEEFKNNWSWLEDSEVKKEFQG
jgi:hypothetical protein